MDHPQFFLSLFFYLVFLIVYYFKGLKGESNTFPIFITIILYVFNILWLYNKWKNKDFSTESDIQKIMTQIILFYFLNLLLIYTYFDPFDKSATIDTSGTKQQIDYKPIIFSLVAVLGFFSIFVYSILYLYGGSGYNISEYLLTLLKAMGMILVLAGIISVSIYFFNYTSWPLTIVSNILNVFILMLTLSILYQYFKNVFKFSDDSLAFPLLNLIKTYVFYVPCLFIDLINYIKKEYNWTTKTTKIIIILEVIVIGLRLLIPYFYKLYYKYFVADGDIIEKGPLYLNKKHVIGVIQDSEPTVKIIGKEIAETDYNYNYSVSSWIWINSQSSDTGDAYNKSTSILDYGEVLQINFNKNKLEFFASTTGTDNITEPLVKIYQTDIFYYQKWNNIILNYAGGTLDIFINNKLVSSTKNITPIIKYTNVIVGSENGIFGGIKDIIYYDKVLTRNDINLLYNKV